MKGITRIATILVSLMSVRTCWAQQPSPAEHPSSATTPDAIAPDAAPVLNKHELLSKYVWSTVGLPGMVHATLISGIDQLRGSPVEWRDNGTGYAKRWASAYAASAIGSTTKYAVARVFHQDPSFTRCECSGFGPRLRHAVSAPFTARNQEGARVFSAATVAGFVAEDMVPATTWYPTRHGARDGVTYFAIDLASKVAVDIFREFVGHGPRTPPREPAREASADGP